MNSVIIFGFLLLIILVLINKDYNESFSSDGSTFLPLGYKRYGLRGEPLHNRPLEDCYWDQYTCYTNTRYPYHPTGTLYN